MMLGELIPCGGGDPIPLLKSVVLIGRRSRCDITLEFPNVSSQHCELMLLNGYWQIRDLNSSNGIKVNDARCDSKWLMPGDVIAIAKHRYEIQYAPSGSSPPPEDENAFEVSLMEKAGLLSRADKASERPRRQVSDTGPMDAIPPKTETQNADEDQAMKWLTESE